MTWNPKYERPNPRTKYCGVYVIRHVSSGRCYVGASKDITNRYTHHRYMLRRGKHKTADLQELWDKCGEGAFEFETVEACLPSELRDREQHWMDVMGSKLLNTSVFVETGKAAKPSAARKAAAKKLWADPEYRKDFLSQRDAHGRFTTG